jgi:hypothetical protein
MWTSLFVSGLLATAQTPLEKLAIPVAPVSVVQAPAAPKSAAPMANNPWLKKRRKKKSKKKKPKSFCL